MDLGEIMAQHGHYLVRVAYLYMKDEMLAEDIVQDVFIQFHRKSHQFEERASVKTYLVKMTVNRCHDVLRKQERRQESLFAKIFKTTKKSPEHITMHKQTKGEITDALFQLSLPYREAIILFYYEEMTSVEIAELLGVTESAVRMRLKRARERLRQQLEDFEWGDE